MSALVNAQGQKIRTADDVMMATAIAMFRCELVSVTAKLEFSADVIAMNKFVGVPDVFTFWIARHPDIPQQLVAFITSKQMQIGAHMAQEWAIEDDSECFARITFKGYNGANIVLMAGRVHGQVKA